MQLSPEIEAILRSRLETLGMTGDAIKDLLDDTQWFEDEGFDDEFDVPTEFQEAAAPFERPPADDDSVVTPTPPVETPPQPAPAATPPAVPPAAQ
jgi:hypothetical protein